ncbi:precorrin-6y C5,15-methyltransferase (decarboxylating) subunit CbiE [Acetobacterium fimetarium]|uniref:Precorrin-6y C5,15-methyltransferase (Decarboxylating) subunit CbiE n=1 Tax=Acetobacterium fimetarium TaxID=52691 RepID=A0ABR6WSQ1_9FIRM|nr:precorrin-6y C5,15-methyltransferase (decarboxylating) subunit CbiE [Acetobacterium fimetarium]MBC3803637.1 precorrin-6y C5,15-methyltransferase (decarboxylating) subunit CbiE [Acetobacterium fimetarium]
MYPLKIIGLGPGHPDYILPIAKKEIEAAEVILCGTRHAESFDISGKQMLFIGQGTPLSELMAEIAKVYRTKKTALVVSGDTGFYSMLSYTKKVIPEKDIVCIPGISSLQYLFAKLGETWQDARLMSLHGRDQDLATAVKENGKLGILTDKSNNTAFIAKTLAAAGITNSTIYVGEELSYPNEKITRLTVAEALTFQEKGMAVVVVINE